MSCTINTQRDFSQKRKVKSVKINRQLWRVGTSKNQSSRITIVKILKKSSKLGMWLVLGNGIGAAIGAAFGSIGIGIVFGPACGLIIGLIVSGKNTNDDNS